ncbi:MAG: hypothetical protein COV29_01460 [Candidatus Yanofskybacteria bacterium CG10_big_fil_rev_8_21_14_0_10_36_16]|uniref:Uncharacterized protein n=1 Tax=Candidatus Yanofskybacteria bacterium CG10_big_fil_rev_8_21_14_0_10_36_16 TaxID=1975096 RepID=A0A2J0Q780_9BACT|nr:MAG: hypothetical protein COV29_01460 [Candidatus Yanofskybacteria bacterium CG10_big_fil_rev_8_21_14_0_10_36_16]
MHSRSVLLVIGTLFLLCGCSSTNKYPPNFVLLKDYNLDKYHVVRKMSEDTNFKIKPNDFYVHPYYIGIAASVNPQTRDIFLSRRALNSECLDFFIAHEMGHLQEGVGGDQLIADYYGAMFVGKEKGEKCLFVLFEDSLKYFRKDTPTDRAFYYNHIRIFSFRLYSFHSCVI